MSIKSKNLINKIKRNNLYFEDLITRSIYHSNKIEGNTLSYAKTYSIIFENKNKLSFNANPREIYEAINCIFLIIGILEITIEKKRGGKK